MKGKFILISVLSLLEFCTASTVIGTEIKTEAETDSATSTSTSLVVEDIEGLSLKSSSSSDRFNPKLSVFYTKGKEIPAGGFFDPTSKDLENAFSNLMVNTHPLYKDTSISYQLGNFGFCTDEAVIDRETLENCALIDSHWSSKGLSPEELKELLEAFWDGIGVFNYLTFDAKKNDWIEVESSESEVEGEKERENISENKSNTKKQKKKNNKKNKKQKNKKTIKNTSQPAAQVIPALMSPKLNLLRSTLEHSFCQRAITASLSVLSPKQMATLFRNVPVAILDNPEIIESITDFSGFLDGQSVDKLCQIMGDMRQNITEAMAETLPITSLHKIIEARNFDVSHPELLKLITKRPGFESQEPFIKDHRTFRIFCAENPNFPIPPSNLILDEFRVSGLSSDVIESILAFYTRSEFGIHVILTHLSLFKPEQEHFIVVNGNKIASTEFALTDLKNILNHRSQIIEAISASGSHFALVDLLKTPLNNFIRLQGPCSDPLVASFSATWNRLISEEEIPQIYHENPVQSAAQVFALWKEVTLAVSDKFRTGRWTRNFLQFLVTGGSCMEDVDSESTESGLFVNEAKEILRRSAGTCNLDIDPFDWFILPIKEISRSCKGANSLGAPERLAAGYRVARELKKVLNNVNFEAVGVIEAIWKDSEVMSALVTFPHILNQKQIDDLTKTEIGQELLKENPALLQRLPTYANFTLEDMNRFNLTLDDLAISIGTLNAETARAWIAQNEGLVNSATRTLFRPHMTVNVDEMLSWPLITFDSLRSDFDTIRERRMVEFLEISNFIGKLDTIEGQLSLIARWLIHMDIQNTWFWSICRIPGYNTTNMNIGRDSVIISSLECSQTPKLINHLNQLIKKQNPGTDLVSKISRLIQVLSTGQISAVKVNLMLSGKDIKESEKPTKEQAREQLRLDNDFIINLIQDGPGSERFKRVWRHRAKLLVLTDIDMKTFIPFEGMEAADQGLIPLDDALLQWFIQNRVTIERLRIKASLRANQGLDPEPVPTDLPHYDWFNLLIR